MQQSLRRDALISDIKTRLAESPVVALLGARQVGKTTLAGQLAAEWKGPSVIFDLERHETRMALSTAAEKLLGEQEGLVIVDEIQEMPELFNALRPLCDAPNRKAVYLLLGSASWELVKGVSESLAGRIQFVNVGGFSLSETGAARQDELWLKGGFPRAFLSETPDAWGRWMESFVQTFLERDMASVLDTRVPPEALARFWRMLAHHHGQTWNAAELARSMDISPPTATRYRDLLAGAFMARVLPPWFENLGKRLTKAPKLYLRDSGVLHYLLGITDQFGLRMNPRYGASWEGFALEQILLAHGSREAYYYRTQRGAELDLLLLRRGKRWGFEFKCSEAPSTTKSMRVSMEDLKLEHLWIVYPGTTKYPIDERITAMPLREAPAISFQ